MASALFNWVYLLVDASGSAAEARRMARRIVPDPVQYAYCAAGQVRHSNGRCGTADCSVECVSGLGAWSASLGMCACEGLPLTSVYCARACQETAVRVGVDSNGQLAPNDAGHGVAARWTLRASPGSWGL